MITILFACVHNAGRSQMAAALFNAAANPARARARSAGTHPAARVHPAVIAVMQELGLNLAAVVPQALTPELVAQADWLVTMGCDEQCPIAPGVRLEDWPLPDPNHRPEHEVRAIRDEISRRVEALIDREGWR